MRHNSPCKSQGVKIRKHVVVRLLYTWGLMGRINTLLVLLGNKVIKINIASLRWGSR